MFLQFMLLSPYARPKVRVSVHSIKLKLEKPAISITDRPNPAPLTMDSSQTIPTINHEGPPGFTISLQPAAALVHITVFWKNMEKHGKAKQQSGRHEAKLIVLPGLFQNFLPWWLQHHCGTDFLNGSCSLWLHVWVFSTFVLNLPKFLLSDSRISPAQEI